MWKRQTEDEAVEQLVLLTELVAEGFGDTPGALVDLLAGRGFAVDVDQSGRLAVIEAVARTLRDERAEAERLAAEEAALRAAEDAERQRVAAEAAAVKAAQKAAERERTARHRERQRRLERAAGMSLTALDLEMRRRELHAPNTGMTVGGRAAVEDKVISLNEMEFYIRNLLGDEVFEEATS